MKKILYYEFDVDIVEESTMENYDKLLTKFEEWKLMKREIKINSLICDKKIQFQVNDISSVAPQLYGVFYDSTSDESFPMSKACFIIKGMTFILKENKVENLKVKIQTLTTEYGKVLESLIKDKIPIVIKQFIKDESITNFYIDQFRLAA